MTFLKEQEKAPDFSGKNQYGKIISLSGFKGEKVILYFYPKDNTQGCTLQACNLKEHYPVFQNQGYEIIGVSNDDEKTHRKFSDKLALPFSIIADTDKSIVNLYGVYGEKMFMGKKQMGIHRTTFIISENGVIERIITKVKTKEHSSQIIK